MNFSIIEIKEIISTLSIYENMDYCGFSISFLKRRLSKLFETHNIKKISQFYEILKDDETRDRIIGEIFVESTEMFRDPAFWRYIRDNILKNIEPNSTIWVPNEASGEEILSLSIILKELKLSNNLKLICNNPSKHSCQNIRNGLLRTSNYEINHLNYKRLENFDLFESYFTKENNFYKASQDLTVNILCKQSNYKKTIENEKVAMILSRNQALYYNHNFSEQYFEFLYQKLMSGGLLSIGIKEKMPQSIAEKMYVVSETEKIYKK